MARGQLQVEPGGGTERRRGVAARRWQSRSSWCSQPLLFCHRSVSSVKPSCVSRRCVSVSTWLGDRHGGGGLVPLGLPGVDEQARRVDLEVLAAEADTHAAGQRDTEGELPAGDGIHLLDRRRRAFGSHPAGVELGVGELLEDGLRGGREDPVDRDAEGRGRAHGCSPVSSSRTSPARSGSSFQTRIELESELPGVEVRFDLPGSLRLWRRGLRPCACPLTGCNRSPSGSPAPFARGGVV